MTSFLKPLAAGLALALATGSADAAIARDAVNDRPGVELQGLDRLLAMEEMKNLRMTFCRSLDNHDWAALRSTMTDDFVLYFADNSGPGQTPVRPPIETKGADQFVELVKQLLSQGQSIHICTMPQFVYVGKDHARALWFINGYGSIAGRTGLGYERLIDDYVRIKGKWLISKADGRIEANTIGK